MCNDYRLEVDIASIAEDFDNLTIKLGMPEGLPNVPSREDIKITDVAPIVRSGERRGTGEFVNRRWSWPSQNDRPVYNFRSEGREFGSHHCLILMDGFYEFTKAKQKRQDKWLFTLSAGRRCSIERMPAFLVCAILCPT
ncbi:putative SOS response-associated peptidase YedK [Sphingobium sp. JAI105]|nr:putative SOS response-associated peptidase YedK [Sphingobium sp. JAI105]